MLKPTTELYAELQEIFDFFNQKLFMSPCGIGLTPLPLGKHFSIIFQWNTEKAHIAHMI